MLDLKLANTSNPPAIPISSNPSFASTCLTDYLCIKGLWMKMANESTISARILADILELNKNTIIPRNPTPAPRLYVMVSNGNLFIFASNYGGN